MDSETLLEAIEKIDITPKGKQKKCRDSLSLRRTVGSTKTHSIASCSRMSPLSKPEVQTPLKEVDPHCARLIDFTPFHPPSHQLRPVSSLLEDPFKTPAPLKEASISVAGVSLKEKEIDPFKTPAPLKGTSVPPAGAGLNRDIDPFKTPVPIKQTSSSDVSATLHEKEIDPFKTPVPFVVRELPAAMITTGLSETDTTNCSQPLDKGTSVDELLARMSFLTQSPARDKPTPFAKKILSKFEGVNFSKGESKTEKPMELSKHDRYGATVEELRHQSKRNLNHLKEQMQHVKREYPIKEKVKERRKTDLGLNSKFLSFVENVKSVKDSSENGDDAGGFSSRISVGDVQKKPSIPANGVNSTSNRVVSNRDSLHCVARLEELLANDSDDNTFTGKVCILLRD